MKIVGVCVGGREERRWGWGGGVNNSNDFPQPGTVQDVDGCTGEELRWVYLASVCFFNGRREGVERTRRRRRRAAVSCWRQSDEGGCSEQMISFK